MWMLYVLVMLDIKNEKNNVKKKFISVYRYYILIEKTLHIDGPAQFKLLLLKDQHHYLKFMSN